jgi:aminoglycoside phosphotransferase (APT) family kinase protein
MINLLKTHPFFNGKPIESCTLLENQGYCNENYLVVADRVKYIVRSFINNTNREEEFDIQKQASLIGIAPNPLVLNLKDRYMIMEYVEGIHQKKLDLFSLYMLIDTISVLHDNVFIEKEMVKAKDLVKRRDKEIVDALEIIEDSLEDFVLCHNDLNPLNILWKENKPTLLDFEYASVNDCYFDLATLSIEFTLEKKEESLMLHRYFGNVFFRDKFEAYKVIYRVLCEEWFQNNI